jgi:hypothetical protein
MLKILNEFEQQYISLIYYDWKSLKWIDSENGTFHVTQQMFLHYLKDS